MILGSQGDDEINRMEFSLEARGENLCVHVRRKIRVFDKVFFHGLFWHVLFFIRLVQFFGKSAGRRVTDVCFLRDFLIFSQSRKLESREHLNILL